MEKRKVPKTPKKKTLSKESIFKVYVLWKSLPPIFHDRGEGGLDVLQVKDEIVRELALIKNQTEFATKFKVGMDTLSDWNKRIESDSLLFDETKKWVNSILGSVAAAVYRKVLIEGDAARATYLTKLAGQNIDKVVVVDERIEETLRIMREFAKEK